MSDTEQLVLIDGSGYIFRAFHALPPMTRGDGTPVNAVYGFTGMVMKLVDDLSPAHVAVVFDSSRKTFRNDIYAAYKATFRSARRAGAAVRSCAPRLQRSTCRSSRFRFRADDLIATYAALAEDARLETVIVSSTRISCSLCGGASPCSTR